MITLLTKYNSYIGREYASALIGAGINFVILAFGDHPPIEETEENLKKYSMPNDFIQELKIYNENQELVQSFEPNDYNEYVELQVFSTEKSRIVVDGLCYK